MKLKVKKRCCICNELFWHGQRTRQVCDSTSCRIEKKKRDGGRMTNKLSATKTKRQRMFRDKREERIIE